MEFARSLPAVFPITSGVALVNSQVPSCWDAFAGICDFGGAEEGRQGEQGGENPFHRLQVPLLSNRDKVCPYNKLMGRSFALIGSPVLCRNPI